jgi:putative PIN family toxin of toxin-antitoxin system
LAAAEAGRIRVKISAAILEEVADVLQRERFGWTAEEANAATEWLTEIADVVEPKQTVNVVKADPDDDRIIECALEGKADYLVTGDHHLLDLGRFENFKIIKPAEFVQLGQGRG